MILRSLNSTMIVLILTAWLAATAWAHNLNNGYSYVRMSGSHVEFEQLLPYPVMLAYDKDGNKTISEAELNAQRAAIESYVMEHLTLLNNEQKMAGKLAQLSTVIQEQTEDPMVRMVMSFESPMPIGSLTIQYNLIYNDVDAGHQNYIQLYDHQELVQHWVVEQGSGPVRYAPDSRFRFDLALMGEYVLFGAQSMLFNIYCWLLLMFLIAACKSMKETAQSVAGGTLYSLIGLVVADRMPAGFISTWLYPLALSALGIYVLYALLPGRSVSPKVIAAISGFAWGIGSLSVIDELHLNNQFKIVSLFLYYSGAVLAWLGLMYVLYMLLSPLLGRRWSGKKPIMAKSLLAAAFLAEIYVYARLQI